jgi:16S rRNA (guanine527-N7)-methyltransferase
LDKLSNLYINEIVEWNAKFNLTGLKTFDDIKTKLYDDSLNISNILNLDGKVKVIDIGCGAGFPGIPLKIEHPNIGLTLVDSVGKKINFVQHVIEKLNLTDAKAIQARAEDIARRLEHREQYDICVSRAVAALNVLAEYCLPFVKVGGLFVTPKGPDVEVELKAADTAIHRLGGKMKDKVKVDSGWLIVIEKIKPTPKEFPRNTGIPAISPL